MNRHIFSRALACAALFAALCAPTAVLSETAAQPQPIRVELSLAPEIPIYDKVAVLPLRFTDNTADQQLTEALFEELEATQKYELIAPAATTPAPPWRDLADPAASLQKNAVAYGRAARIRAVVSGVIVAKAGALNQTGPEALPLAPSLIISLTDIARDKPVWRLTLTPPPDAAEQRPPREQLQDLLHEGVEELIVRLVNQGDVYTTRLPKPRVLSSQARLGRTSVVVQAEKRSGIVACQLLRAPSPDAAFLPASEPAANRRSPLTLEDDRGEDATPAWYTVIGLTASGLATVPAPPFQVAVAPAAPEH